MGRLVDVVLGCMLMSQHSICTLPIADFLVTVTACVVHIGVVPSHRSAPTGEQPKDLSSEAHMQALPGSRGRQLGASHRDGKLKGAIAFFNHRRTVYIHVYTCAVAESSQFESGKHV